MPEEEIGKVSDFYSRLLVAGIELSGPLKVGDQVHMKGHTTDLSFTVESIQIDNQMVNEAHKGDAVGIKIPERVRHGDKVYKVT